MNEPKRHHFIPRLHLQHFTGDNPRGHVWTYDALNGQTRSAIPEETAIETHFYSFENADGTMNVELEKQLSKSETAAAPIYEDLLVFKIPEAETRQRATFAVFLALMYFRTPAMRRMYAETFARAIQIQNYAYGINQEAFEQLSHRVQKSLNTSYDTASQESVRQAFIDPSGYTLKIPKERTFAAFAGTSQLANILFHLKWSLITAEHGFFVTSDNPLVLWIDPATCHPVLGSGGFFNDTAEVTFPLSPKILLLMSRKQSPGYASVLPKQYVARTNQMRAAFSDRYLYSHIHHKHLLQLATQFRDSRPGISTSGFGPEKFSSVKIRRRGKRSVDK